jgi:hypothetical protein
VNRESSVGRATRYLLEGPGIKSRTRPDWPWGLPSLLYNGYRVSFPGLKRPERGVDHPSPSSAEVKERVELYLYSPSGPSWPVLGLPLRLPLPEMLLRSLWKFFSLDTVCEFCVRVKSESSANRVSPHHPSRHPTTPHLHPTPPPNYSMVHLFVGVRQ